MSEITRRIHHPVLGDLCPECGGALRQGMFFPDEGGVWLHAKQCDRCVLVWRDQ